MGAQQSRLDDTTSFYASQVPVTVSGRLAESVSERATTSAKQPPKDSSFHFSDGTKRILPSSTQQSQQSSAKDTKPAQEAAAAAVAAVEPVKTVKESELESLVNERAQKRIDELLGEKRSFLNSQSDLLNEATSSVEKVGRDIAQLLDTTFANKSNGLTESTLADIETKRAAVVACYKNNSGRSLDCWSEVDQFKESVRAARQGVVNANA
ncbi:hypothetical protein GQ42DRAFT_163576 [Ramicandelaber brevisporus]|nr:hypothetical protein GQ42DRAFT_163576 [Ramicandelaber brevisporus]